MAFPGSAATANTRAVLLPAAATWQHVSVTSASSSTRIATASFTNALSFQQDRRGKCSRGGLESHIRPRSLRRNGAFPGRLVGARGENGGCGRGRRGVCVRADGTATGTNGVTTSGSSGWEERREEEIAALVEEVKSILARDHASLPVGEYGRDDDAMLRWFLKDRKYKVEPTVEKLAKAIKWRHEFGVAGLTAADVAEEGATGKAFLHEYADVDGRPVIVVVAAKHFPDVSDLNE
ncbi:unnamed protein product [Closterium sp. Naga37s-1]|nr:unnamed protein product [Closterium sp. Naga37s-1]